MQRRRSRRWALPCATDRIHAETKGGTTGPGIEQRRAQPEQVASRGAFTEQRFRREEAERSRDASSSGRRGILEPRRQPKVDEDRPTCIVTSNVGGTDVPVDEPASMKVCQSVREPFGRSR